MAFFFENQQNKWPKNFRIPTFSYLCTVNQRYMIDEKAIQKLLRDYARERDENVRNSERISALTRCADELTATMHEMKEKYETAQMTLMKTVVDLTRKNENLEQRIVELEAENKGLREMVRQHRGKRFASTSEQASLLGNRTPMGATTRRSALTGKVWRAAPRTQPRGARILAKRQRRSAKAKPAGAASTPRNRTVPRTSMRQSPTGSPTTTSCQKEPDS